MFWVNEFEVVHWAFWQREKLAFNRSLIGLFGPNGSGKTSFLDAIRTAFGIECAGDRNYQHYVRANKQPYAWLRAVLPNDPYQGQRPFRAFTKPVVTVFCKVSMSKGGEWHREYLLTNDTREIEWAEANPKAGWMGVTHFRKQLENAGLTREIANVMRIPQDQTSKLADMSPQKLLDLVLDVRGDKAPLEAWREARENQTETQRTLRRVEVDRDLTEARVQKLSASAESYRKFERLTKDRQEIVARRLPQAEYLDRHNHYLQVQKFVGDDIERLRDFRVNLGDENSSMRILEAQLVEAREEQEGAMATSTAAAAAHSSIKEKLDAHTRTLEERDGYRMQSRRDASGIDPNAERAKVRAQLEELHSQRAGVLYQASQVASQLTELPQGGKPPSPKEVREFAATLDQAGIQYRSLTDVVQVDDATWTSALEGVLAPYRHIVLLSRDRDAIAADALGEKMRYRHFIVDAPVEATQARKGSLLEKLTITGRVPSWLLQELDGITCVDSVQAGHKLGKGSNWITPEAFHRSSRGGRSRAIDDGVFSAAARERMRENLKAQSARLAAVVAKLDDEIRKLDQENNRLGNLIAGLTAATALEVNKERYEEAEKALPGLKAALKERETERNEASDALSEATSRMNEVMSSHSTATAEAKRITTAIVDLRRGFVGRRKSQREAIRKMGEMRKGEMRILFTSEELAKADRTESVDTLKNRLRYIEGELESDTLVRNPGVLDDLALAEADLNIKTELLTSKQADLQKAIQGTISARTDYIKVVRRTVAQYEKAVRKLAEPAGIEVGFDPLEFGSEDEPTANSGLKVNVAFHGKEQGSDGMASLSGGQKVVFSMILLLALLGEERPQSMFFIDEPFAHLDSINVELVAKFLDQTPGQFLITIPERENADVFERLGVAYYTRLRKPKSQWAPRIAMAERVVEPLAA